MIYNVAMMRPWIWLLFALAGLLVIISTAFAQNESFATPVATSVDEAKQRLARSRKEVRLFRSKNPCPATGEIQPTCKGFVVDHVKPKCAGGEDKITNMQYQSVAQAKKKDKIEIAYCRCMARELLVCR